MKTKTLTFLFFIFYFAIKTFSQQKPLQNSFIIESQTTLSPTELSFYEKCIVVVDFEKYRLKTKEVVLEFTNGFKLVLNSAEKASLNGFQINSMQYSDELSPEYIYPLFKIDSSGILVTMHKIRLTKSEMKNKIK